MAAIDYTELTYKRPSGVYVYPGWAIAVGWMLAVASIICVPIMSVYKILQYRWSGKVCCLKD